MNTFISKDELDHSTLYVLFNHVGESNAIARQTLVSQIFDIGLYEAGQNETWDRQVRQSIERLRHAKQIICNTGNGNGYYIAATVDEYQAFRANYGAHAFPIMEAIRSMDDAARDKWPNPLQPRML